MTKIQKRGQSKEQAMTTEIANTNRTPEPERRPLSPQELKNFIEERMQWALNMYPLQLRPSLETLANYTVEWLELMSEVGPERFSEALVKAVRESEYFPVISKIRQHAGMGTKQQSAAGASAAWMWLWDYLRKWPFYEYSDGVRQPKGAPAVPHRINHAARLVGGLMRIQNVTEDALPFVQRDFCAAWENYEQSAAAYNDLQLAAPLLPKLLAEAKPEKPQPESPAAVLPVKRFPVSNSRPLSDAELAEKKLQAEIVAKRFAK